MTGALRLVRISLLRLFGSPRFYLALGIGVLVLLSENWHILFAKLFFAERVNDTFSFAFMLSVALSYTVFPFVFAPLCALAGSLEYCEDAANMFVRPLCARISPRQYIRGRILSAAIRGGLTGMIIIIVSALLLRSVYPAHTAAMQTAELGAMADSAALLWDGWGCVLKISVSYLLGGMAISVAGLACSAVLLNRYVAVLMPLLLFMTAHFLTSYLGFKYTPLNLLMTYEPYSVSMLESVLLWTCVCGVFATAFRVSAKKRLAGE